MSPEYLEKRIASRFRKGPFVILEKLEKGNFSEGSLPDPHIDISSKRDAQSTVLEFIEYINETLEGFGITDVKVKLAYNTLARNRIQHRLRILYVQSPMDREKYQELTREFFRKLPSMISDFYQKNKE